MTDIALEWAEKNVKNNPHVSELIEIRKADGGGETVSRVELHNAEVDGENEREIGISRIRTGATEPLPSAILSNDIFLDEDKSCHTPPVLVGVVKHGEKYDFCMCNPPFFESMEEAGLNPKTSCGGTPEEMVCPGGERAFITRIIEDSIVLKQSFRYHFILLFFFFSFIYLFIFMTISS